MSRRTVAIISISSMAAIALAVVLVVRNITPPLPDYQKDGKLLGTWSCDNGKTTVNGYENPDKKWAVAEYRTASGDVFVALIPANRDVEYYALVVPNKMKSFSEIEFDFLIKEKAPAVHNILTGQPNDCKKERKQP